VRSSRGILKTGSVRPGGVGQDVRYTGMVGFSTAGVNILAIALVKYTVQRRNLEGDIQHPHATERINFAS